MSGMLDMIGISIDAATEDGNIRVGRCNMNGVPNFDQLARISDIIHTNGIRLKINTVVSKLNLHEDLNYVYGRLRPNKVKLFYMHVVDNINASARTLEPTREEYESFVKKISVSNCEMVVEGPQSMQNAYFMINPAGECYLNDNGTEKKYGSCLEKSLTTIFEKLPISEEKFLIRYSKAV